MFDIDNFADEILENPELNKKMIFIAKNALENYSLKAYDRAYESKLLADVKLLGEFKLCAADGYAEGFIDGITYIHQSSIS